MNGIATRRPALSSGVPAAADSGNRGMFEAGRLCAVAAARPILLTYRPSQPPDFQGCRAKGAFRGTENGERGAAGNARKSRQSESGRLSQVRENSCVFIGVGMEKKKARRASEPFEPGGDEEDRTPPPTVAIKPVRSIAWRRQSGVAVQNVDHLRGPLVGTSALTATIADRKVWSNRYFRMLPHAIAARDHRLKQGARSTIRQCVRRNRPAARLRDPGVAIVRVVARILRRSGYTNDWTASSSMAARITRRRRVRRARRQSAADWHPSRHMSWGVASDLAKREAYNPRDDKAACGVDQAVAGYGFPVRRQERRVKRDGVSPIRRCSDGAKNSG